MSMADRDGLIAAFLAVSGIPRAEIRPGIELRPWPLPRDRDSLPVAVQVKRAAVRAANLLAAVLLALWVVAPVVPQELGHASGDLT